MTSLPLVNRAVCSIWTQARPLLASTTAPAMRTEEFDTLPKCRAWLLQEPDSGPEPRTYVVTEQCSDCEREVEIHGWDTERDGYQAFCPYCGEVLMLCDECQHSEQRQPCDFDMSTGMCRHRKKNTPNDFEEVKQHGN